MYRRKNERLSAISRDSRQQPASSLSMNRLNSSCWLVSSAQLFVYEVKLIQPNHLALALLSLHWLLLSLLSSRFHSSLHAGCLIFVCWLSPFFHRVSLSFASATSR